MDTSFCALLWDKDLPKKISCFIWLALRNKILTWENLQKRGKVGPGMCALCCSDGETVDHLFTNYFVWKTVTDHICDQYHLPAIPSKESLATVLRTWTGILPRSSPLCLLPFHMMWIIWKARNQAIFKGKKEYL